MLFRSRQLQVLALYPANSIFMDGYLNTQGNKLKETLQMIQDAGFDIKSDQDIEELLKQAQNSTSGVTIKSKADLRPTAVVS